MKSPNPIKTLWILWGVALLILIGGIMLARQQTEVRIDRNRESLRTFAVEAQIRLQRLDNIYQNHLVTLGRNLFADDVEAARMAGNIHGVIRASLLHPVNSSEPDFHVTTGAFANVPQPTFKLDNPSTQSQLLLEEDLLFGKEQGWIDEPGKPLVFHLMRTKKEVLVVIVSREMVNQAVSDWMTEWSNQHFDQVRATGGPDQLRENGKTLVGIGNPGKERADMFLPLMSRFGNFEVLSWDVRKTIVNYNPATLAIGSVLSVIIALLAVIVFLAQRREEVVAAQRVSFINGVSHELRTPLTNILLNIDLAAELAEDTPTESERRLDLVRIEARRLGRLIDNILTYSRTEKGKLEIHPTACVPEKIITGLIEQFTPSFNRRGLILNRIDVNTDLSCLLDPDALMQILGNLLSNVEKYVPSGEVNIFTRLENDELTVRVTDQGPGIPHKDAERIFRPFERLHSKLNEGASGAGLGLAISQDLAKRLGGSLLLLPCDIGCCFELRVPAPLVSSKPKS